MVQKNCIKNKIILIGGPTASGKSSLAVACAKKFNGEIISADSMQIYKSMDIGTGKITPEEARGVCHHMLSFLEPNEQYSAGKYVQDAERVANEILERNHLPIFVGGTGLYLNGIINGMNFSDVEKSFEVRKKWQEVAEKEGHDYLYNYLLSIDSVSAQKIDRRDIKRIIRAIEIYEVTGKTKSEAAQKTSCKYDYLFVLPKIEREELYAKINARVDKMFNDGFLAEATALKKFQACQSMQAIGYKQILEYLDGKYVDLPQTIAEIKKLTRNYAKRQMTFFNGMNAEKIWIDFNESDRVFDLIHNFLQN